MLVQLFDDQFALYVSISIPFSTIHNAKYKFVIDWIVKILQTVMTIEVNQLEWSVRYNAVG